MVALKNSLTHNFEWIGAFLQQVSDRVHLTISACYAKLHVELIGGLYISCTDRGPLVSPHSNTGASLTISDFRKYGPIQSY